MKLLVNGLFSYVLCYTFCFVHLHDFINERVTVSHDAVPCVKMSAFLLYLI